MLYTFVPGEPPAQRICRIVRDMAGCSVRVNRSKLAALIAAAGPYGCEAWPTDCATFALGVLRAAAGELADARNIHPRLAEPLQTGMAFAWLVQIGNDLKAWRRVAIDGLPKTGAVGWFRITGTNDDHAEFKLSETEHGGGGRQDNAVTVGTGRFDVVASKPLFLWLDPDALGIQVMRADDPAAPVVESGG